MTDFLLELGTEEVPASYLDAAMPALAELVRSGLEAAGLRPREVRGLGTPRRLTAWAGGVPDRAADVREERVGPSEKAGFDEAGRPTVAAQRFAESLGLRVEDVAPREVAGKKGRYLWGTRVVAGRTAAAVLADLVPAWIDALRFPKSMRWVPGSKARFARPLRRITALLGDEVVRCAWGGVESGRRVEGHRFLHSELLTLNDAGLDAYLTVLRHAKVLADPAERRRRIEEGVAAHLGPEGPVRHAALVAEVVNLVEWPVVDVGTFDERYLELPKIVVVEAMTGHQRFFPVETADGKLEPRFAYVANRPLDPVIRNGNSRVLAARLQDALFFFRQDQKTPLDERVERLKDVVFMAELGSYHARIERIDALCLAAARAAGWAPAEATSPRTGTRVTSSGNRLVLQLHLAAQLARTDLTTEVVQEFPELQGEMGAIYARLQGHDEDVAEAIREAYLPRGEGGGVPGTRTGTCLALADKLDTVACAFATGRGPTGAKDPFMVRRSVLGVLRILRERTLDVGYGGLVDAAVALVPEALRKPDLAATIKAYVRDRLSVQAIEAGKRHDLVRAALAAGDDPTNVVDFWTRLDALHELAGDAWFPRLVELVERTKKITDKNGAGVSPQDVDASGLEHPAEKGLHGALAENGPRVRELVGERRYAEAGREYARALADVTHTFFEPAPRGVFVMDEDPRRRTNRLALLKQVHRLLADGFADLAQVAAKA